MVRLVNENPVISVVIPVFDRAQELENRLVEISKWKCDFVDIQVIIVDDCSSVPVVVSHRFEFQIVLIRHEKNLGVSAARNTGVKNSDGLFVGFLDSDDSWSDNKVSRIIELFNAGVIGENDLFYSSVGVTRKGKVVDSFPDYGLDSSDDPAEYLFVENQRVQVTSFVVGSELAKRAEFRDRLNQYEDFGYFIEVAKFAKNIYFDKYVLSYWVDDGKSDRLSHAKSFKKGLDFCQEYQNLLSERTKNAFFVRHILALYFYRDIRWTYGVMRAAVKNKNVTYTTLLKQIVKANVYFLVGR